MFSDLTPESTVDFLFPLWADSAVFLFFLLAFGFQSVYIRVQDHSTLHSPVPNDFFISIALPLTVAVVYNSYQKELLAAGSEANFHSINICFLH